MTTTAAGSPSLPREASIPLDQLGLSGQCGFSSTVEGNALTRDQQRAKLDLIVQVARDIWGD